ncbi:hypothetical protein OG912_19985 [Streptomyces sp. NBC_00464]|uniref:hypothetical protein n=1 Tax=unclassified Streptomyces TaxID=2593676 RepID=UPI002DDAF61C|nr:MULTISPECIES: hypothetical protein [unclassified Streptomyces]WRZ82418.1 hypothetical protein OG316_20225 [Streptomyces sp. NBC_01022]
MGATGGAELRERTSNLRTLGWAGSVAATAAAVLTAALLGRAWSACDVGVNNSANGGFLLWVFIPVLTIVLLLTWLGTLAVLHTRPLPCAVVGGALVLAVSWCALSLFWEGTTYHCPSGVPPWWPDFVPHPGF